MDLNNDISRELKAIERDMEIDKQKTLSKKKQLINELKMGLGEEIKRNPRQVKIIKKPLSQKIKLFLAKIFTRF